MKRKGAKCDECPFRDKAYVPSEHPPSVRMAFVGEAPGEHEERTRSPFVGPAGSWLMSALSEVRLMRSSVYLGNALCCHPPSNDITTIEAKQALECCRGGLLGELSELKPKVIVALGNTALNAFVPDNFGMRRERGSVHMWNGIPVIPTYHPSAIMRSQERVPMRGETELSSQILRPVWIADMLKAKRIAEEGWAPPEERFILHPNVSHVEALTRALGPLAVDIETCKDGIFTIAIALDPWHATCIPYKGYWNDIDFNSVKNYLRYILKEKPTIFQNAKFDVSFLEEAGFEVGNINHDIMLLHHAISPEFPHDLGFIVSQYGQTPYWKGEFRFKEKPIEDMDTDELRTYNCRDAVVLHQVLNPMLAEMRELGEEAYNVYQNITMKLIRPVMAMEKRGILISPSRLRRFKEDLHDEIGEVERKLRESFELPGGFNLDSDDDVRLLLYGEVAPKFKKAASLLPAKKNKNTKVYRELSSTVEVLERTPTLKLGELAKGHTASGKLSVSDDGLLALTRAISTRRDLISRFKRPTLDHLAESKRLEKGLEFVVGFQRRNELAKLLTTYTDFAVGGDNRVHPSYLLHGTATGRLSSKSPNIQNQPEAVRKVFLAEEGNELVSADYSNLELRVLAVVAQDQRLLDIFESGKSVHDVLTFELFGVGPEDPRFKIYKRAEKTFVFGRNYGGTLRGIYERLLRQVPECGLSFARFTEVDEKFRKALPGVERWTVETKERVARERKLENCFGRIRVFWGSDYDILKEGLNFPIQSAAADIINQATIGIYERGLSPICQVHDQLLFELPSNGVEEKAAVIRQEMEREFTIHGRPIRFPVELSRGQSWGELTAFSV